MATSIADLRLGHPAARPAQPYWNPYLAGFALGLVLLGGYLLLGRGLGATGAFSALAAWVASLVSPESAAANPVHARYLDHGPPLLDYVPILVLGTLIGGGVSAWLAGRTVGCSGSCESTVVRAAGTAIPRCSRQRGRIAPKVRATICLSRRLSR